MVIWTGETVINHQFWSYILVSWSGGSMLGKQHWLFNTLSRTAQFISVILLVGWCFVSIIGVPVSTIVSEIGHIAPSLQWTIFSLIDEFPSKKPPITSRVFQLAMFDFPISSLYATIVAYIPMIVQGLLSNQNLHVNCAPHILAHSMVAWAFTIFPFPLAILAQSPPRAKECLSTESTDYMSCCPCEKRVAHRLLLAALSVAALWFGLCELPTNNSLLIRYLLGWFIDLGRNPHAPQDNHLQTGMFFPSKFRLRR